MDARADRRRAKGADRLPITGSAHALGVLRVLVLPPCAVNPLQCTLKVVQQSCW